MEICRMEIPLHFVVNRVRWVSDWIIPLIYGRFIINFLALNNLMCVNSSNEGGNKRFNRSV